MATKKKIVILEQCQVAPPPGGAAEKLLHLTNFDIIFLQLPVMQSLFFYELQCSKSEFVETIVPKMKSSLSLALKHFPPLAGKIILPLTNSATPVSHYVAGDSIPLTFAQSHADFVHLTGNHYRNFDDFCDFVPKLGDAKYSSESIKFAVAACQITLFPDRGVCIGFAIHHSIADAATMLCFLRAWFSIIKLNRDSHLTVGSKYSPFYDRIAIKHFAETRLSMGNWDRIKNPTPIVNTTVAPPTNNGKVRAMFTLDENEILHLKKLVLMNGKIKNVTTYVVVSAYLWTCFAKSADEVADDDEAYVGFPGDCRARMDPPLPYNYFGNCIVFMLGESTHGRLRGKEGIVEGVLAIEDAIGRTFGNENKEGVIDVSGYPESRKLDKRRLFLVAGSTNYDQEGADFGWGQSKKVEIMNVDGREAVSLGRSSDSKRVLEIGLSMSRLEMDAFAAVFKQGIRGSSLEQKNELRSKI